MKAFRWLLSSAIVVYVLALAAYLVLRLIFGGEFWWLGLLNNFAPYYFLPAIAFVPLALLLRLHARYVLLPLLMLVVALVWFGPRFVPGSPAEPTGATITVVSMNLWAGNRQLDATEAWLRQQNADLILLQESYHDIPLRLADRYPYMWPSVPVAQDRQILSRFPIVEQGSGDGYDRVVVDAGGTLLAVYDVHLNTPFRNAPWLSLPIVRFPLNLVVRYDEAKRNEQLANLLAHLRTAETLPVIVAGDFNTSDNSAVYPTIAAQLTDSYREAASGLGTTWPNWRRLPVKPPLPPVMRIDYIWHSDAIQALDVQVGPDIGSDHRPLVARLALPG